MFIDNLEAFKTWLSKTLEPICDADPSALAKYVVALVKKDKSEKELKALCIDQLDVFLQKDTQLFVDKLFEAVNSKSYLPQPEQTSSSNRPETHQRPEKEESKREEVKEQPSRDEDRDKKFSRRINHSPPSSSRYSRDSRDRRVDDRKKDGRTRNRDYDRNPPRRDSYRDRYNRRRDRSRSYSRSRSRSWSKDRPRERDRDRERDRSRSRSRSKSLDRSRERDSGKSKYDHTRPDRQEGTAADGYPVPPLPPGNSSAHFPVPTLSSTITVIAPSHHGNNTTESWSEFPPDHTPFARVAQPRKRCRDYDEKGFCMRGDMCPFDHGSDPVVVEDVNLPNILPFQPPPLPVVDGPPPPGLPPPPSLLAPPVNLRPPVPPPGSMPPSLPPVAGPPPPLPALQPSGMDGPPNSITSSMPTIVRPPITQPPPPLFTPDMFESDMYNPEAPSMTSRPMFRHRVNARRSNLIGLTMGEMGQPPRENMLNSNSARIVLESDSRKRGPVLHDGFIPPKKPWFDKPIFSNPNHHGFHRKVPFFFNTKLSIRQIPPELNNISKLNDHFSKFGTIVNLQVAYNNDPEGALIQFATPEEAKHAIMSTEAVLNNRFISVHWHRQDAVEHLQAAPRMSNPAVNTLKQSVKDRLGPLPAIPPEQAPQEPGATPQNAAKIPVKERLGASAAGAETKVFSTSTGLTKTVYNVSAIKPSQKGSTFATHNPETILKRKLEALKLQQDVRKKKQEILEKHIQTQKLLISKLEKNKSMKAEDKAQIMQTLTTLTNSITKLQEEIKALSSTNVQKTTPKSKAQAQKELLDTELDLYKKMQAGEDIAELKIKYTQLQLEAAKRGLLNPGRGRGVHARGRGSLRSRGRGMRGHGRGAPSHAVVDHRPRALEISGFTEADRVDLLPHFAQFGEIEDFKMEDSSVSAIVTYRSRAEAEQAAIHGVRFNNLELHLAWHKPTTLLSTTDPDEAEHDDDEFVENSLVDDSLLQDDDEEEEDNESRSWRR